MAKVRVHENKEKFSQEQVDVQNLFTELSAIKGLVKDFISDSDRKHEDSDNKIQLIEKFATRLVANFRHS